MRAFIGCRIGQNLLDDWAQNVFAASRPSSGESRLPYSRHKQIPKVSSTNPSLSESDRGGWYLIPLVFWGVAIFAGSSFPRWRSTLHVERYTVERSKDSQDSKRIPRIHRIQRIPRGINGPSSACGSNTRRTLNHPYTLPCRPVGRWAPRTMLPPGGLHSPERRQLLVHTTPFNINIIWHQRGVSFFLAELEAILSSHA